MELTCQNKNNENSWRERSLPEEGLRDGGMGAESSGAVERREKGYAGAMTILFFKKRKMVLYFGLCKVEDIFKVAVETLILI